MDMIAALKWVLGLAVDLAVDPGRISLFGDAGGGTVASVCALELAARGEAGLIKSVMLISPQIFPTDLYGPYDGMGGSPARSQRLSRLRQHLRSNREPSGSSQRPSKADVFAAFDHTEYQRFQYEVACVQVYECFVGDTRGDPRACTSDPSLLVLHASPKVLAKVTCTPSPKTTVPEPRPG